MTNPDPPWPSLVDSADRIPRSRYTEVAFSDPAVFIDAMSKMHPSDLSQAAEVLAQTAEPDVSVPVLLRLMNEGAYAVVREGAVLGLGHLLVEPGVREALSAHRAVESSTAVVTTIDDVLDDGERQ